MTEQNQPSDGDVILYQTSEGTVRIEVLYDSETFWLNQKKIAELFGVDLRTISYHLKEIYDSGELQMDRTLQKYWRVQIEGRREFDAKSNSTTLMPSSPSVIASIARRRPSSASGPLKPCASLSSRDSCSTIERLKLNKRFGKDYFDELLERIREIRASERRFYLKITDIYEAVQHRLR